MQFHRLFLSRCPTLYNEVKTGKKNHSLLRAKANKFSRNVIIDSKPPGVTAHNTAFKSPFTIMSKFYHSGQRIAFFQPQINQVAFLEPEVRSSTDLKIRRLATATARARIGAALFFNANCSLVQARFVEFPRKSLELVSVNCEARKRSFPNRRGSRVAGFL